MDLEVVAADVIDQALRLHRDLGLGLPHRTPDVGAVDDIEGLAKSL